MSKSIVLDLEMYRFTNFATAHPAVRTARDLCCVPWHVKRVANSSYVSMVQVKCLQGPYWSWVSLVHFPTLRLPSFRLFFRHLQLHFRHLDWAVDDRYTVPLWLNWPNLPSIHHNRLSRVPKRSTCTRKSQVQRILDFEHLWTSDFVSSHLKSQSLKDLSLSRFTDIYSINFNLALVNFISSSKVSFCILWLNLLLHTIHLLYDL